MLVRAFIAVDISPEAREALAETLGRLQLEGVSGVRWVKPEGIHLTLKFLGDVDGAAVGEILAAIERGAGGTQPFYLGLSRLGAFPSVSNPRVIWVGLKGELDTLRGLQERIDHEVSMAGGFPKESRPFTPHLTLGRMRENVSGEGRRKAGNTLSQAALSAEAPWQVSEVTLVQSTLTSSGAIYELLGSCSLRSRSSM